MSKLAIDLSGRGGLVERYQGDLSNDGNDGPQPHKRYLGGENQMADGIWNPMKSHGYLEPANASFTSLSNSPSKGINSIVYDAVGDDVYLSEEGVNIWQLINLEDVSLSAFETITTGHTIKDMVLYEINNSPSLFYAIDTNDTATGSKVGFKSIDSTKGVSLLENDISDYGAANLLELTLVDTATGSSNLEGSKLAQSFNSDLLTDLTVTGARIKLRRSGGTGASVTLKLGLYDNADPASGIYTSQGAWTTATSYAINDTVTNGGETWMCYVAHTSDAFKEPGVGVDWFQYWQEFGSPVGTALASNTFSGDSIDVGAADTSYTDVYVEFSSPITLTASTKYWLVLEDSATTLTASDEYEWLCNTTSGSSLANHWNLKYIDGDATPIWAKQDPIINAKPDFDFSIISNGTEDWSSSVAVGAFTEETGVRQFLHLADNALLYWFAGRSVHTIDGSLTGGFSGQISRDVLQFPSYVSVADVAETRSRMYIGVQTSDVTTSDTRRFTANRTGIYVWDRRSQVVGGSDFYPTPGAKEIKTLFTASDGNVLAITVGNTGFCELRAASGNQYATIHTLEKNAWPHRRGVGQIGNMSIWLGQNGIFYAYGSPVPGEQPALFKIGDMSGEANAGLTTGPIFVGEATDNANDMGIMFGWTDSDPSYVVQTWDLFYESAVVTQTPHQGDVYTKVYILPALSVVNNMLVYCLPTSGSDTDTIATLKLYKNQSSTPFMTKTIREKEAARGYIDVHINTPNVNALQAEIEFDTATQVLGNNSFRPSVAIVDYTQTSTRTKDNG